MISKEVLKNFISGLRIIQITNPLKSQVTINFLIRLLSLSFKLIFTIIYSNNFTETYSEYVVINSYLVIGAFIFGRELYVEKHIEYLKNNRVFFIDLLYNNKLYIFISVILFVMSTYSYYDFILVILIIILTIVEYLNLELFRSLNILGEPVKSNIFLFLKSASWVPIVLILKIHNIKFLILSILLVNVITLMFQCISINSIDKQFFHVTLVKNRVRDLKKYINIMILASFFKFVITLDKIFVEKILDEVESQIYLFNSTVALFIVPIFESTVTNVMYRKLNLSIINGNVNEYKGTILKMLVLSILGLMAVTLFVWFLSDLLKNHLKLYDYRIFILSLSSMIILSNLGLLRIFHQIKASYINLITILVPTIIMVIGINMFEKSNVVYSLLILISLILVYIILVSNVYNED